MKLTGYYMTAICKFEDGIKTICVVDAQNRAQMLERLKADLEPYGQVEQFPKMEGRQMIMVLSPKKKK